MMTDNTFPPVLIHQQVMPYLKFEEDRIILCLDIAGDLEPEAVFLRIDPDNEEELHTMQLISTSARFDRYQVELKQNPASHQSRYTFKVLMHDCQWWLDAVGVSSYLPVQQRQFRLSQYQPPAWVPEQVFYQVFPERFCNGDPAISVKDNEYQMRDSGPTVARNWGEAVNGKSPNNEFFGGDLIGVREQLKYLQELGVTALYLNPVFTSPSVHKYDIEDYYQVDPHFGGNQALADLSDAMHQRGMRLILDAVINHTSDTHPWFNRWDTHPAPGAYQSKEAPYRQAYLFFDEDQPETYYCWKGSKVIPVLDLSYPPVPEYFYGPGDSVLRHWLKPPYNIDGWRMDVIHMMGEGAGAANNAHHVRLMRAVVKDQNPDAYFLGEHFFEATSWLQGEQEDGAMNYYGFALPLRAFLAEQDVNYHPITIDADELNQWLDRTRTCIPYANQLCQLNLLDSHDTRRFFTMVDHDQELMKLGVLMQFTYPGVPAIYYGDEIGMQGENDPYNRACFEWNPERWNTQLRSWYQQLAHVRQSNPVLQQGGYVSLYAEGDVLVFARTLGQEQAIIAVNRGEAGELTLDLSLLPRIADQYHQVLEPGMVRPVNGYLHLSLKEKSGCLLLDRSL